MATTSATRERVNAVQEYLNKNGISFDIEHGGKHPKMVLSFSGTQRKLTLAGTPGDHRGIKNWIAQVKRTVGGMLK